MAVNLLKVHNRNNLRDNSSNSPDWDLPSVLLTWALILTVTRRLLVTHWTEDLYLIAYIVNLAFLFGLALGYSRFRNRTIVFLTIAYGTFFTGWRLGLLQSSVTLWNEKIYAIYIRLSIIFQHLANKQPVYDNLLFLLLMMILFWMLGVNTGYSLLRSKHVLRIIAPLFVTLILIHTYDMVIPSRNGYLFLFSILALIDISRLFFIQQREGWKIKQFYIPPQLSSDIAQFSLGFIVVLLILSFIIPSSRSQLDAMVRIWEKIKEPFQSIRVDFENAFSSLTVKTQMQPDIYERTLNLGRGNELSEQEIFTAIARSKIPQGVRLFWRSRIYDQYENGQWTISEFSTRDFEPNAFEMEFPTFPDRSPRLHSFMIYLNQPLTTLILPSQPYWTNLAVQIEYVENSDGTIDLIALRSDNPLPIGKTYNARSSLSTITVKQLQETGEDYPPWVTERYLQLPSTLTERTKMLALQITKDLTTPYDKVVAVTDYLRTHITYKETLEELPADRELIDWFLFEHKRGFCNYYATAEVLLLRSLGIPARLAVGYAEGTMEDVQTANVYIIRQRDAHAWPEVFFPGIGWIEFEPTSSQPALTHPQQLARNEQQPESPAQDISPEEILKKLQEEEDQQLTTTTSPQKGFPFFSQAILVLVIITLVIWINFNREKVSQTYLQLPDFLENKIRELGFTPPKILIEWNQSTKLTPIEKNYQCINTALRIIRDPPPIHYTPSERASHLLNVLPEAEPEIRQLIQHYQDYLYGNANPGELEPKWLKRQILRLAWQKRLHNDLGRLFNSRE